MKDRLHLTGQNALLIFGLIANAASILSVGISYVAAPSDTRVTIVRLLGLIGAVVAAGVYLFLAWLVLYRKRSKQSIVEPLAHEHIYISSPGPALFLNRQRSHAEIQITVFSPAPVELLYIEAKILDGNMEVLSLERSKPVSIPKLNPQNQIIGKSLTEKELERFNVEPGTFFRIAGLARFRGPLNEDLNVGFAVQTAVWVLPD